jgi:peptide/nickel transport system permease protein
MQYFRRVVLRRLLQFVCVYIVLVYALSALFSVQIATRELQTLEVDLRWQHKDLTGPMGMTAQEYETYIQSKLSQVKHERGYDKPFLLRTHALAMRMLSFNFGTTLMSNPVYFQGGVPVMSIVGESAIPTVVLFGSAFLIQMLFGVLLGVYNASRPGRWPDRLTALMATTSMAIAPAVAAMFVVLLLVFTLPVAPRGAWVFWLPAHWSDVGRWSVALASHIAAPLATVVFLTIWQTAHIVRNVVAPVMHDDHISAARGRGLPERRVLYGHGLRVAAPPIATMLTLGLTSALWGNFFIEPIFQWRGLGSLFLRAIQANEINLLMALLVVCTLATQAGILILDLLYSWLDPRIRTPGAS